MKKTIFILYLFIISFFGAYAQECNIVALVEDISKVEELKEALQVKENFESWLILTKEKSPLSKNIDEIKLVADNLSDISAKGGYSKWVKSLEQLAPSEAKLKHLLAESFDPKKRLSKHYRGLIYNYYKQAKSGKTHLWKKIEDLFNELDLNGGWPLMNGGYKTERNLPLKKGEIFDRYQGWFSLGDDGKPNFSGEFTSPVPKEKGPYTFTERALRGEESGYKMYYQIKILKDLPIKGEKATIIPWFNHKGGGKQVLFKFDKSGKYKSFKDLLEDGYIEITIKDIPSGDPDLIKNWKGKRFVKGTINATETVISNSNLVILGRDFNKTIDRLKKFEAINKSGVNNTSDVIDIVVHGADNKMLVDGIDITDNIVDLKKWLANKYPNSKTIRLLSCTNLEGAQDFANALSDYKVHATDGFIRVHTDGKITNVPREIGGDTKWYVLTKDANRVELPENARPRGPDASKKDDVEYLNDFLELSNRTPKQINWATLEKLNPEFAIELEKKFAKNPDEKLAFLADLFHTKPIKGPPAITVTKLLSRKGNMMKLKGIHIEAWRALKAYPNLQKGFFKLDGFSHVLKPYNKLEEALKKEFLEAITTTKFKVASKKNKSGASGAVTNPNLLVNNIENFKELENPDDIINIWKNLNEYKQHVNAQFSFKDIKSIAAKTFDVEDIVINYGVRDYNLHTLLQLFKYDECYKSALATNRVAANTVARLNDKMIDLAFGRKFDDINEAYKVLINGELKSINDFKKSKDFYDALVNNGFNTFEAHHVMVVELFKSKGFRKWYEQIGHTELDLNGENSLLNVIMLEGFKHEKGVHASHSQYNKAMKDVIDERWVIYSKDINKEAEAINQIGEDIQKIRAAVKKKLVEQSVIGTGKGTDNWQRTKVNDLITTDDVKKMIRKN